MSNHDDPTKIGKALIIADPWIGLILDGSKTWEMRSSNTAHRGWFGLIRKGTGEVWGIARLVSSGPRLSSQEMADSVAEHRIPVIGGGGDQTLRWNVPWKLAGVLKLSPPVPYRRKSGAVRWVILDEAATAGIARQVESIRSALEGGLPAGGPTESRSNAAGEPGPRSRPWVATGARPGEARPRSTLLQRSSVTESVLGDDESLTCVKATKKMSIWRTSRREIFAVERPNGEMYVIDSLDVRDLPVKAEQYPASKLNQIVDGKERYGRHSGLKSVPQLRMADLVRFLPDGNDEVRLLLEIVKARR